MKYIFLLFCCTLFAQNSVTPNYILLDKFDKSDLNYLAIDSIDFADKGIIMLENVFNVIPGKFTIYRFLTKDKGILFDGFSSELNNLIILKVNSKNKIVDGFQYFLQNSEMPSKCFLYRISKIRKFDIKIKVSELRFKRVNKKKSICDEIPLFYTNNLYLELHPDGADL